ncbi:hypothetical protein BJ322DRAFT_1023688 [Thelephora terrestris]|uniref:Uncharacterized protein n=1 Tax=Thelephora terrestris TaxID=56493 RepID=A0A9P6H7R1_9AGAM|nr:hypothetical protein BJ322DRAFT_1023688 [Thelephora terrestris]
MRSPISAVEFSAKKSSRDDSVFREYKASLRLATTLVTFEWDAENSKDGDGTASRSIAAPKFPGDAQLGQTVVFLSAAWIPRKAQFLVPTWRDSPSYNAMCLVCPESECSYFVMLVKLMETYKDQVLSVKDTIPLKVTRRRRTYDITAEAGRERQRDLRKKVLRKIENGAGHGVGTSSESRPSALQTTNCLRAGFNDLQPPLQTRGLQEQFYKEFPNCLQRYLRRDGHVCVIEPGKTPRASDSRTVRVGGQLKRPVEPRKGYRECPSIANWDRRVYQGEWENDCRGHWGTQFEVHADREKSLPTMEGGAERGRVAGEHGDAVKRGVDDETEEIERDFTEGKGTCTKDDPESGVSLSNQNAASANSAEDNEHLLLTVAYIKRKDERKGLGDCQTRQEGKCIEETSAERAKDSGRVCSRGTRQMKEINKMGREMHKEGSPVADRKHDNGGASDTGKGLPNRAREERLWVSGCASINQSTQSSEKGPERQRSCQAEQEGRGRDVDKETERKGSCQAEQGGSARREAYWASTDGRAVSTKRTWGWEGRYGKGQGGKGKGSRQVEQGGSARREAHWASTDGRAASTKRT